MKRYSTLVLLLSVLFIGSTLPLVMPKCAHPESDKPSMDVRLDELANQISGGLLRRKTVNVAFLDFTDLEGKVSNLGRFVVEELTTRLSATKGIRVVERRRIDSVLQEQKLSVAGVTSRDGSKNFGELIGANVLVSGTVSDLGSNLRVNVRLISTESGQVLASGSVDLASDDKTRILLGKTVLADSGSSPSQEPVPETYLGIWRERDGDEEYYYEIKKNGFVFYCELHNGQAFDLDTGIIQGNLVTYSEGKPDNLETIIEDSVAIKSLPEACK